MPSETQLREIFDALGDGVFVANAQGAYLDVNPAACRMLGYSKDEMLKLSLADLLDASEWRRLPAAIASYGGGSVHRSEWLFRRSDGSKFHGELVGGRLPDGRFQSVVRDISERLEREKHEQLLVREAAHRTKNILALVQALGRQTALSSPETFVEAFGKRIEGLAASHALFITNGWERISLEELVRVQLAPFAETTRISVAGPPVSISTGAAQSLGMALHELATNAAKYGALSALEGTVEIEWGIDRPGSSFKFSWSERGGPAVRAPERRGFGTRMIAQMMERALQGKSTLNFESSGLTWSLVCDLQAIARADSETDATVAAVEESSPTSARVLFVQPNDPPPSFRDALNGVGMTIAGRVSSAPDLLAELEGDRFDIVVADESALGDEVDQVLIRLSAAGKPAIVVVDPKRDVRTPMHGAILVHRPLGLTAAVSMLAIMTQSAKG